MRGPVTRSRSQDHCRTRSILYLISGNSNTTGFALVKLVLKIVNPELLISAAVLVKWKRRFIWTMCPFKPRVSLLARLLPDLALTRQAGMWCKQCCAPRYTRPSLQVTTWLSPLWTEMSTVQTEMSEALSRGDWVDEIIYTIRLSQTKTAINARFLPKMGTNS